MTLLLETAQQAWNPTNTDVCGVVDAHTQLHILDASAVGLGPWCKNVRDCALNTTTHIMGVVKAIIAPSAGTLGRSPLGAVGCSCCRPAAELPPLLLAAFSAAQMTMMPPNARRQAALED